TTRPIQPEKQLQKQPHTARRGAATTTRQPAHVVQDRKTTPAALRGTSTGRSPKATPKIVSRKPSPQPAATTIRASAKAAADTQPKMRPTGKLVARLRRQQGLSVPQFAAQLGVSPATVYRWEITQGSLNLQARLLNALVALQQQAKKRVQ